MNDILLFVSHQYVKSARGCIYITSANTYTPSITTHITSAITYISFATHISSLAILSPSPVCRPPCRHAVFLRQHATTCTTVDRDRVNKPLCRGTKALDTFTLSSAVTCTCYVAYCVIPLGSSNHSHCSTPHDIRWNSHSFQTPPLLLPFGHPSTSFLHVSISITNTLRIPLKLPV